MATSALIVVAPGRRERDVKFFFASEIPHLFTNRLSNPRIIPDQPVLAGARMKEFAFEPLKNYLRMQNETTCSRQKFRIILFFLYKQDNQPRPKVSTQDIGQIRRLGFIGKYFHIDFWTFSR
ncbi:hypothetical protein HDG42_006218 [Paraburkholderia sp. JPY171]|nr:hypothetical protein [Paraburkholderia atlantica]